MPVLITNKEAYSVYISNERSVTFSVRKLIENNHLPDEESYDHDATSEVCREIIDKGSFSGVLNKVQIDKCAYILDSL